MRILLGSHDGIKEAWVVFWIPRTHILLPTLKIRVLEQTDASGRKVLATKSVRVSPGPHLVEEDTQSLKLSSDLHICTCTHK